MNEYNLRGSSTSLFIPRPRTEFLMKSFSYSGAKIWNQISENIYEIPYLTYNFVKSFPPRPSLLLQTNSSLFDKTLISNQ